MKFKTILGYLVALSAAAAIPPLCLVSGIALFQEWSSITLALTIVAGCVSVLGLVYAAAE